MCGWLCVLPVVAQPPISPLLLLLLLQVESPFTADGLLADWEITQRIWEYALRWAAGQRSLLGSSGGSNGSGGRSGDSNSGSS